MRYLDIYQDDTLIITINVTDISLDKVDDITIDSDGDIVDYTPLYTPRLLSGVYEDTTTLDEIDELTASDDGLTATYDPYWLDEKEID